MIKTALAVKVYHHRLQEYIFFSLKFTNFLDLILFYVSSLNQVPAFSYHIYLAISIPNVHGKKTKASVTLTRGKRARTRSAQLSHSVSRFQALRLEAQETIESIFEHACQLCPSTLAQVVGILASEARLLSSVINEPETDQNILALKTIMLLGIHTLEQH